MGRGLGGDIICHISYKMLYIISNVIYDIICHIIYYISYHMLYIISYATYHIICHISYHMSYIICPNYTLVYAGKSGTFWGGFRNQSGGTVPSLPLLNKSLIDLHKQDFLVVSMKIKHKREKDIARKRKKTERGWYKDIAYTWITV